MEQACVVAVFGRQAIVEIDGGLLPCNAVGSLLRREGPLAAGDLVVVERSGDEGIVRERRRRASALLRSSHPSRPPRVVAANIDQVLVVLARHRPEFSAGLADRVLVAAAAADVPACLCVNKADLARPGEPDPLEAYTAFPSVSTSALDGRGLTDLGALLARRITVAVGHSGVGKSSLLNRLVPGFGARVQEVNRVTGRGRHTTTTATLVRLPGGGTLIDTPGIRAYGLSHIDVGELDRHVPEMEPLLGHCAFDDCGHDREPGCAVRRAVEEGVIPRQRYEGYLAIRESLTAGRG